MDTRFSPHNTHLEAPDLFIKRDPYLKELQKQLLVHRSCLLDKFPRRQPGIYTIGGGRQVGRSLRCDTLSATFPDILYQGRGRG